MPASLSALSFSLTFLSTISFPNATLTSRSFTKFISKVKKQNLIFCQSETILLPYGSSFDETVLQVVAQLVILQFFSQTFFVDFFVKNKVSNWRRKLFFAYCKKCKKTFHSKSYNVHLHYSTSQSQKCEERTELKILNYSHFSFHFPRISETCYMSSNQLFFSVNGGRSYSKMHLQFITISLFAAASAPILLVSNNPNHKVMGVSRLFSWGEQNYTFCLKNQQDNTFFIEKNQLLVGFYMSQAIEEIRHFRKCLGN